MRSSEPPTESSLARSNDEITLHLIATGLLTLVERIEDGHQITAQYPSELQRGLNRLILRCLVQGVPPPKSVPDLLAWSQRPFNTWSVPLAASALDPSDVFLEEGIPTRTCEDWAHLAGDVEADLREREFFQMVRTSCANARSPESYVRLREIFIRQPVVTAMEYVRLTTQEPLLAAVVESLKHAFVPVPASHLKDSSYHCCPKCRNLLFVNRGGELVCENEHCRGIRFDRGDPVLDPHADVLWLRREIRRYWVYPGLAELRLADALKRLGVQVELWPDLDQYDLRVAFPDDEVWAVDVKDWANPILLARQVRAFPQTPSWTKAYFVFPEERRRQRSDYRRAFVAHCGGSKGLKRYATGALFEKNFVQQVKNRLQQVQHA